jgi:hypothetical protein
MAKPNISVAAKPEPKSPRGNRWLLLGAPTLGFANSLFVQKHGNSIPDSVIYMIYAIAAICFVIGLARVEKFAKAGGKVKLQIKQHQFSFAIMCLLLSMLSCNGVVSLVRRFENPQPIVTLPTNPEKPKPLIPSPALTQTSPTSVAKTISNTQKSAHPQSVIEGSDNTVVNDGRAVHGNGNTIVGATDDRGNTIFNQGGTAIGRGAHADPTSVAIGAGAGGLQQPTQQCATGSQCNTASGGGIILNPTVTNNFGPPEPKISFTNGECKQQRDGYQCMSTIKTDIALNDNVAFTVVYDGAVGTPMLQSFRHAGMIATTSDATSGEPVNTIGLSIQSPSSLEAGGEISVYVHSVSPVKVIRVSRGNF